MNERTYKAYVQILEDELIVATGCTEPIAIAFASAKAAQVLGCEPERISISVSGNIIKNVHSVTVPNTGGQHGVKTAVAAGIAAGDADKGLDVLSGLNDDGRAHMARYLEEHEIRVEFADTSEPFYIDVRVFGDNGGSARVVMAKNHTNVVLVERDGEILQDTRTEDPSDGENALTELLNVADIIEFADTVDLADVEKVLSRQAEYNYAISCEGLKNDWGGRVGKLYASDAYPNDLLTQAKAAAAAGSDARMGGCPMPVVIVSGSGNQGITASVPIVVYARALDIPRENMLRALAVSDLISIYQKSGIGCLSAFCGAVSAGAGAACGIAYLFGGRMEEIKHTIVNSLGTVSGMICDGAKPSCAAKIAMAIESGVFGYRLFKNGNEFYAGDGIVTMGVDETIRNVSRMAREGMRETDREILSIMIDSE